MMLYIRDPEISMRKLQKTINNFSKMVGGGIGLQKKSVAFLNINSKYAEKEIMVHSFYKNLKKIRHLEINLTKGIKDFYNENFKSLKKRK